MILENLLYKHIVTQQKKMRPSQKHHILKISIVPFKKIKEMSAFKFVKHDSNPLF